MIGKHLKEYKKKYKAERRAEPRRCRIKKNSDWKKRWMPFIKYDHDFDGGFFLELIVHKLHIMLDFYEHGKYCMQVDESRLEIVDSLREACRLGDLILADEFDKEALDILGKHMHISSKPSDKEGLSEMVITWDDEGQHELYEKLSKEADKEREKTIDKFFKFIRKEYRKWWD